LGKGGGFRHIQSLRNGHCSPREYNPTVNQSEPEFGMGCVGYSDTHTTSLLTGNMKTSMVMI